MLQNDSFDIFKKGGEFHLECYDGITGELKWKDVAKNTVLTVGKHLGLDILFDNGTSKVTTWHLGVSNDNTAVTAGYVLSGEIGTRQATEFTRTGLTVDSDQESFTSINDTVRKAFVATASSGGTIFAVSDLSAARTLVATDVLKVTYSINAT